MGYNSKILADAIKKLNERKVASKPKDIPLDVKGNGMLDPRFAGKPVKLNTDTLYNPTPYKIKAVADNGTERILNPFDESDVYFPGANTITEYPQMKKGGLVQMPKPSKKGLASKKYSRSLFATNKLFTENPLFKKPKSKKRKVFDPNAKYYQDGGISYSNLPTIYQSALQNFIYPNVEEDSERVGYNSVSGTINYDSQSPIENMDNDWWREHEMFHHLQNQAGGMSTSGIVGQRPNPYAASDESMQGYYNRRDADVERTIDNMISQDPNLQFIPRDKLAQSNFDEETGKPIFIGAEDLQYSDPSTLEGEARQYEQYIKEGNPSIFSKKQNGGVTLPDDYIELDLSPEEIEQYAKGGYVVEELPEMQPGGPFKPGTGYKMPALSKSEIAAIKKEISKAKPVAAKSTTTVKKPNSSKQVNKSKEDAAYEKFLDQNLGKEGSNTYTYVDPRTGKTEQREYSNAHLKDNGNISVDEATWNTNRDRQNMQHLSEALSGVGEITGINSAIRTGERLIDDPLKFADDLTTGISQVPETLVEGAMTLGSKLFGDNKDYVDVDTDALGVALDVAGALPVFGVAGKAAKPVLKTGLKYSDDVLNSLKGYRASAANKNLKNPNIQFQGSQIFDYEDVPEVLSALRQRGQNLDKLGAKGSDLLHSDMINYHGTYAGRPIVEVKMPDGSSEMFYKSSGWAGKKGAGTDGTTEGMWQVYGGHSKNPNAKADNWFIKDYGYTDYYGSNTYKEMAENLDNALIQKYNFKDVNELDDAFNFKNKYGNVDTYVPSSNDFPSTAFYKTNNARVNASDNLINESQIISDPNSKTSIIESLDQFPENIRPSKEQVQQVIDDNINYIKSPEYKKLRMQNTGETEAEVDKAINSYIKSFNKTKLTSKSNAGNSGQYTRGNFLFSPEIGIDPMISSSDEFLNILDHEIKHGLSPFSQSGKANTYKNYPVLEGTPIAKDPSLKEFFIGMDPNKKAMMADVNYHNLPYEQQVRALRLKNQIKKDLGVSAETPLKESDIQNWMSKHPYRLPESLNDVEDLFRINTSTPTNKGVANWLNNAWMTIPATGITGATIYGTSENSTELQNYKEGGYINKMSKGGEAIKVINYLMSQGLTRQQASGIAGNLQQESSFRPNAKGSLGHVGIAQWDKNDRWPKVKKYIESQGLDPFSLDGQLAGLVWEAKKRKDWDKILKTKTPEESAQTWLKHFEISGEKPGQKGYDNRLKYAKSLATQRDPNSPFDESVRDLVRLEAYREGLKNKSSVTASNEIPYRGIRYNYPTEGSSSNIDPLLTGAMKFNDDVTLDDVKPKKESSDLFASLLNMISAQEKEKEQEKLTEDPRQEVLKLLANQYPIPYSVIGNNSHQSFVNPYVYANDLTTYAPGGAAEQKIIFSPKEGGCPKGEYWTGTECKKIPPNTKIVYSKKEYDRLTKLNKLQNEIYNNALIAQKHVIKQREKNKKEGPDQFMMNLLSRPLRPDYYEWKTIASLPKGIENAPDENKLMSVYAAFRKGNAHHHNGRVDLKEYLKRLSKAKMIPKEWVYTNTDAPITSKEPWVHNNIMMYPVFDKPSQKNYILGYIKEKEQPINNFGYMAGTLAEELKAEQRMLEELQPLRPDLIKQDLGLPAVDAVYEDEIQPPTYTPTGDNYIINDYHISPSARKMQRKTNYNSDYYYDHYDDDGNLVLGETTKADQENRRINFKGASTKKDLKAQKEYNKAYDEYEKLMKQKELEKKFIESQIGMYKYLSNKKEGGLSSFQSGGAKVSSPMASYYPTSDAQNKIAGNKVKAKPSDIKKSKSCGKGLVYDFEKGKCVLEKEIFTTEGEKTVQQYLKDRETDPTLGIITDPYTGDLEIVSYSGTPANQFTMGPQSAGNADWFWQAATLGPGILKGVYEGAPTILSALNTPIKNIPQLTANNLLMTYFGGHSAANLVDPESTSRQSLSKAYENPTAENILDAAGNTLTDALGVVFSPGVGGAMTAGANYLTTGPLRNAYKINPFAGKLGKYNRIVGPNAIQDLQESSLVRAGDYGGSSIPGQPDWIGKRTTPYPSFGKGIPTSDNVYAQKIINEGKIPYIISTNRAMKASTLGRHGRGSTQFPVDDTGKYMTGFPANEAKVFEFGDPHWLKGYKEVPKELPGSPNASISDKLKQFFDRPPGPMMLLGPSGGSNMIKKNMDYYKQLLDSYDARRMSSANRKFYNDIINTGKKQNGMVTEAQLRELDRLKTGDFNFGKKGYANGGSTTNNYIETYIPEEDIKKYLDDGYNVVEF